MKKTFIKAIKILERYKSLGYRELGNGTKLIGHVPHVAPEAWHHRIFPPLNENSIREIEKIIHMALPDSYVEFLKSTNGINMFSDSLSFSGLRLSYVRVGDESIQPYHIKTFNLYERPEDSENSFVFVGHYFDDGSLLYIDKSDGAVYRCTRESSKPLNRWDDFWGMLLSETIRLSKLFDRQGKKIDPDKPTKPEDEI
jgi:hypothetical protein